MCGGVGAKFFPEIKSEIERGLASSLFSIHFIYSISPSLSLKKTKKGPHNENRERASPRGSFLDERFDDD